MSYLSKKMNLYHILLYIIHNKKQSDTTLYMWMRNFKLIHQISLVSLACSTNTRRNIQLTAKTIINSENIEHELGCKCEIYFNYLFESLNDDCLFENITYKNFQCINKTRNYTSKSLCIRSVNNYIDNLFENSNSKPSTSTVKVINNEETKISHLNVDIKSLININSSKIPSQEYSHYNDIDTSIFYNDQYKDTLSIYGIHHILTNPEFEWDHVSSRINCFEFYVIYILIKNKYFTRLMFEFILPEYLRSSIRADKSKAISIDYMIYVTYNYITKFLVDLPKISRTTISIREPNIINLNKTQFFNFLNAASSEDNIIQLNYKGIKCYIHIFDKKLYIFDDYGRKIKFHTNLPSLSFKLFNNDVILLECIRITKSKDIYQSGYCDFNEEEIFIILDVLYYNKNLINEYPFNIRMKYFQSISETLNLKTKSKLKSITFESSQLFNYEYFAHIYKTYTNIFSIFGQYSLYFNGVIIRPYTKSTVNQPYQIYKFKFPTTKYLVLDDIENGIYIPPVFDQCEDDVINVELDKTIYKQLTNSNLIINIPQTKHVSCNAVVIPDYESKFFGYFIITQLNRQIYSIIIFNEYCFEFYLNLSTNGLNLKIINQYKVQINKIRYKVGIVKIGFDNWDFQNNIPANIRYIRNSPFKNILNTSTKQELLLFSQLLKNNISIT